MTRREIRPVNRFALLALVPIVLGACHLVSGPPEGRQDWWYFCDNTGCYRCNVYGCEMPGSRCSIDSVCPPTMFCDPSDGLCKTKNSCQVSAQCGAGLICQGGTCVPGSSPCSGHPSCGDGAYCSNGSCKNTGRCSEDSECAKYGSNFVCDERGSCVPGTPAPTGCQSGSACADGLCLDGSCGACSGDCGGATTCQFDRHCGPGRVCLNGQCTSSCGKPEDCGAVQACKSSVCAPDTAGFCLKNSDCGGGKVCANNKCYEACTATGTCSSPLDLCGSEIAVNATTVRLCMADHTAQLECKVNKDCTGGELCVNGVCRTVCTKTEDCAACPDGPVCGKGGFCMTAIENSPECATNAECSGGKVCLNAQCTTL